MVYSIIRFRTGVQLFKVLVIIMQIEKEAWETIKKIKALRKTNLGC